MSWSETEEVISSISTLSKTANFIKPETDYEIQLDFAFVTHSVTSFSIETKSLKLWKKGQFYNGVFSESMRQWFDQNIVTLKWWFFDAKQAEIVVSVSTGAVKVLPAIWLNNGRRKTVWCGQWQGWNWGLEPCQDSRLDQVRFYFKWKFGESCFVKMLRFLTNEQIWVLALFIQSPLQWGSDYRTVV